MQLVHVPGKVELNLMHVKFHCGGTIILLSQPMNFSAYLGIFTAKKPTCATSREGSNRIPGDQLDTFFVNGEWVCSLFMTNSGHADKPATFAPCVKSMAADLYHKMHNVPHGGLPYNFVRQLFFTLEIFYEKYIINARVESCVFLV